MSRPPFGLTDIICLILIPLAIYVIRTDLTIVYDKKRWIDHSRPNLAVPYEMTRLFGYTVIFVVAIAVMVISAFYLVIHIFGPWS